MYNLEVHLSTEQFDLIYTYFKEHVMLMLNKQRLNHISVW